ncbi:MAG: arginine decarboxylase, pyruvoyl-dependent, partial [Planctomycetes bacterium]|nr:arginine decarboxylase, pyruvoyl-dependent [Planctomycetota bacterium]
MMIPRLVFFTKGVGKHKDKLQSFELALRVAGIEKCNLVRVSSIFPPQCKIVTKEQGVPMLKAGQVVFCVMSDNSTNEPNRMITASVGMAVPSEPDHYGYLSEHHAYGETEE